MKGKRGRPFKKKPLEKISHPLPVEVVEEILSEDPETTETIATGLIPPTEKLCDCGRLADRGSHQCWNCSHRS